MSIENATTWEEHTEVVGKVIRSFRRTDHEPTGDNYIVIEFEDGTRLELGANDLGTWVINAVAEYATSNPSGRLLREARLDYATVKALAEQLAEADRSRLISELTREESEIAETAPKLKRYAGEFYGIWKGLILSEEDIRSAEWHPADEDLNAL